MNTNHSNVSFQTVRVFCSKTKTRLLLLAFLLCLSGSAWAQSPPFALTMPNILIIFKGSSVAAPRSRPLRLPPIPAAKPGPTPLGPPITQPGSRR